MLIVEKMKEMSTTISHHEEKCSEKFTQVVVGIIVYRNGKIHSTKFEMVSNKITKLFLFIDFLEDLAVKSSDCRAFLDTVEKEQLINLMFTMY